MIDVIIWYSFTSLIGFLTFPISFRLFSFLPDRGYAFSRPLGLLISGLLAWWAGCLGLIPFLPGWVWSAVGILAGISGLILARSQVRREMVTWLKQRYNLKYIVLAELVFLTTFAFMLNLRSFFPQLNQSEKFFNLAFINAIATSPVLPPADPWFGGQTMNYYYGGHYLIGFLCKLTETGAATANNIALGLVYGFLALVIFGFVANMVGLARYKGKVAPLAGLLGVLLLAVLGNLYPLRQLLTSGLLPLGDSNFPLKVDWPGSARMIYDPMPDGRKLDILTEYPIYSYLNGDLHAHLMGAPYVIMVLGLILQLFATPGKWVVSKLSWRTVPRYLGFGLLLGALYFINLADFPTYLMLTLVSIIFLELQARDKWGRTLRRIGVQATALLSTIYLIYIFQFTTFSGMLRAEPMSDVANIPVVNFLSRYLGWVYWHGTNLSEFVEMFGLFLLPIATFLTIKYVRLVRQEKTPYYRLGVELITALTFCIAGWMVNFELLGPGLVLIYVSARIFRLEWKLRERDNKPLSAQMDLLVLLLLFSAGVITLFCEVLYIRDIYSNRFNTVFKYWYQLWVLYGLTGAYSIGWALNWFKANSRMPNINPRPIRAKAQLTGFSRFALRQTNPLQSLVSETSFPDEKTSLFSNFSDKAIAFPVVRQKLKTINLTSRNHWIFGWVSLLILLAISASAVPILSYWQTTNGYTNRIGLDGEIWYAEQFPSEYKAMAWLRDYTANQSDRRGVVLEANGMNYSWATRISTYTGLPTVVGWPFHELQWRGNLAEKDIWESWLDMNRIYETTDVNRAIELLNQHNVKYVFVGQIENGDGSFYPDGHEPKYYSAQALDKFGSFMKTIYADPANKIFIYAF
ncbi:DUF2298 domain-containing protein [Candidatus Chlorohelix sp.]|uniref:DUF2298 domain-containing protein n=1 Tax=Candidatus Chlorohelix sp. TaxID=3139201 RepID=UPI0030290E6B